MSVIGLTSCDERGKATIIAVSEQDTERPVEVPEPVIYTPDSVKIEKAFLYDNKYTLADEYPYKDTTRIFQWNKIKEGLFRIDSLRNKPASWGILQNRRNIHGEAPLVKNYSRNAYNRVADSLGVERYQGIPLFAPGNLEVPQLYGLDGSPVKISGYVGDSLKIENINIAGNWIVPSKYVKEIGDTIVFNQVIFVDRTNQNIATFEKDSTGVKWLVRSMMPATTGVHSPPFAHETPLGIFVIQEKKEKMLYTKDGSTANGGFAPYANRFSNGGYVHGVPTNAPGKSIIEYSPTLGTTPRSHMCVRTVSSHAKFIFEWSNINETLVFVIE